MLLKILKDALHTLQHGQIGTVYDVFGERVLEEGGSFKEGSVAPGPVLGP